MILAVSSLACPQLNHDISEEQQAKCKLIYWRFLDIVFKIDCIPGQTDGSEYLNLHELGSDMRLESKFNLISGSFWGN